MNSPADRITLIRRSLRIFAYGLASLVPVIGFLYALFAVGNAVSLGRQFRGEWNPALAYLRWGLALAVLSLGINSLALLIVAMNLVPPYVAN